jgi:glycosyltransferase involved in cell wall biosynthesis
MISSWLNPLVTPTAISRHRCDALLLISHLQPGGTLEMLLLVARELRALGFRVALMALYRGNVDASHDLPECDVLVDREALDFKGYVEAFGRLAIRMRALQPAAVLGLQPAANIFGALAGTLTGVRRRVCSHHQASFAEHRLLRIMDRVLSRIGLYSQTVFVSRSVCDTFRGYPHRYMGRYCVIPNGILPIEAQNEAWKVRRSLAIRPDAVLFVALGRLSKEKNLLNTIAAAGRVPNVQFVLVGEGPQRSEIENFIKHASLQDRTLLLGKLEHQAAVDILFAADVFVQLSEREGRSLALLEALYAGKAILASDIPAQREALTSPDGTLAAMVCDPAKQELIAAAMSTMANDKALRRELEAKAIAMRAELDSGRMGRDYALVINGKCAP